MTEPIKLSVVAGTAMTNDEIANWGHLWMHHIEENSRPLRSLILIAESVDGEIGVVLSGRVMDKARMVGVMHMATGVALRCENGDEKAGFLLEDVK